MNDINDEKTECFILKEFPFHFGKL